MITIEKTKQLVIGMIGGTRKGLKEANYVHSIRVCEALRDDGYNSDIYTAGLLHDIIEDGDTTAQDLLDIGYSDTIVDLVVACTHDDSIKDSWTKRKTMMDKIDYSKNNWALIIKLADITDNTKTCHMLSKQSYHNFINKKIPYILDMASRNMSVWELRLSNTISELSELLEKHKKIIASQ